MIKRVPRLLALLPLLAAAQPAPHKAVPADVLVWSQPTRAARFSHMETVFPHRVVPAGGVVHLLPRGRPLAPTLADDAGRPETIDRFMAEDRTAGLLVLQDGRVRLERYGPALGPHRHWAGFSLTKSVTSTLFGIAIAEGRIGSLDDPIVRYLPEMKGSAYDPVTIRQLLTMSSGVRWNEDYTDPQSDVVRMYGTPSDRPGLDPILSYMRHLPAQYPPGTHWAYKTGETDLAGMLLSRAVGTSLSGYLSTRLWRRYGMADRAVWMINEQGHEPGGCCLSATLEDWGRFGQFVLDGGRIGGRRVLPADWLPEATTTRIATGYGDQGYGYFWWANPDGTFDGRGIFGQMIHVDPRRRLVVVVLAAWPEAVDKARAPGRKRLIDAIAAAADRG